MNRELWHNSLQSIDDYQVDVLQIGSDLTAAMSTENQKFSIDIKQKHQIVVFISGS